MISPPPPNHHETAQGEKIEAAKLIQTFQKACKKLGRTERIIKDLEGEQRRRRAAESFLKSVKSLDNNEIQSLWI